MTAIPPTEWLQDTMHRRFDELKLGPVEVAVMRTDEEAVCQVRLLNQRSREGGTAVSTFRFSAGRGDIKRDIQRAADKAARQLEVAIHREKTRRLDG